MFHQNETIGEQDRLANRCGTKYDLKFSRISEIITIKVKMKHRILLPFLLQLVDGKPLEQLLLTLEIAFQGRYEQRLSKSSWTTQKVYFTISH